MPRRPPRDVSAFQDNRHHHVMGDHVLFENTSTAKRFPFLSSIPQKELASMFHVPLVDREEEKQKELEFAEPYVDQKVVFRQAAVGKKPFVPTNAAVAKESVVATKESVFIGTYWDHTLSKKRTEEEEKQRVISNRPFSYGGSALAASAAIQNPYYLNAMDSEIAQQVRDMTSHRIKVNRELLAEQGYGTTKGGTQRSSSSNSNRNRSQLHHHGGNEDRKRISAGPRPMSGAAPIRVPNNDR